VDEALCDHLVTGRHHALIELRLQVGNDDGVLDWRGLEGVEAAVVSHLRRLLPARASMSALSDLRFVVLLPLIGAGEEAEMIATGLLAELPIPFESRDRPMRVKMAAGVAMLPDDGRDAVVLLGADRPHVLLVNDTGGLDRFRAEHTAPWEASKTADRRRSAKVRG